MFIANFFQPFDSGSPWKPVEVLGSWAKKERVHALAI